MVDCFEVLLLKVQGPELVTPVRLSNRIILSIRDLVYAMVIQLFNLFENFPRIRVFHQAHPVED